MKHFKLLRDDPTSSNDAEDFVICHTGEILMAELDWKNEVIFHFEQYIDINEAS